MILGLPWQSNYKIGCNWNMEGKHFITIKGQFLALSIKLHVIQQVPKTKGQCNIQYTIFNSDEMLTFHIPITSYLVIALPW